jgi:PIN domain nuclease of toxin-antitoxin system
LVIRASVSWRLIGGSYRVPGRLLFGVVSFAEIGIKVSAGKLDVPDDLQARIADSGVRTLTLSSAHGLAVSDLPVHHRDPFDRLIIAQAMIERLTIVTADTRYQAYGVELLEA